MQKPLAFPEIKRFDDLFESVTADKSQAPDAVPFEFEDGQYSERAKRTIYRRETIAIGPFCSVSGIDHRFSSLYVKPTTAVADYIRGNMIAAGVNDSISFEAVIRADGTALIVARNSVIIGSRWLALVDASTVPAD